MRVTQRDTYPTKVLCQRLHVDTNGTKYADGTLVESRPLVTVDDDDVAIALIPVREIVRENVSGGIANSHKRPLKVYRVMRDTFVSGKPKITRELIGTTYDPDTAKRFRDNARHVDMSVRLRYGLTVSYTIE